MPRAPLDSRLARAQSAALVAGVVGAILCGVGFVVDPRQFFRSYLLGYLYWLGMGLGCLSILMVQHLSGGRWGQLIRRFLEAGAGTLPLMAVLFLPVAFGVQHIYEWVEGFEHEPAETHAPLAAKALPGPASDAAEGAAEKHHDPILEKKAFYLTLHGFHGFYGRAVIYFAIWTLLAFFLNRWSLERDRDGLPRARRFPALSGLGLILYALTMMFASVDWGMSLEPHWYSTMYPVLFMVGQAVGAMAFVTGLTILLRDDPPVSQGASIDRIHDLGTLLMAFVMLWAYISFSQYLIIWSGNIPEETPWYVHRTLTSWRIVALLLVAFHFAVPFMLLISRVTKRNPRMLGTIAAGLVVMRLVNLLWLVAPAFHKEGLSVHWLDLVAPLAIGGIWLALFFWLLRRRIAVPVTVDPH